MSIIESLKGVDASAVIYVVSFWCVVMIVKYLVQFCRDRGHEHVEMAKQRDRFWLMSVKLELDDNARHRQLITDMAYEHAQLTAQMSLDHQKLTADMTAKHEQQLIDLQRLHLDIQRLSLEIVSQHRGVVRDGHEYALGLARLTSGQADKAANN